MQTDKKIALSTTHTQEQKSRYFQPQILSREGSCYRCQNGTVQDFEVTVHALCKAAGWWIYSSVVATAAEFSFPGSVFVLTLISISVLPPCYRSGM